MTKASQIMTLHKLGKSTREISLKVYGDATQGHQAYVRVVTNQRKGSRESQHDLNYRTQPQNRNRRNARVLKRNLWRWHNDPEFRARQLAGEKRRRDERKKALTTAANQLAV